ncbi:MAG: hypothetical protein WB421_04610 [Terriglobales bacterium]|jgi:hypothetical protein
MSVSRPKISFCLLVLFVLSASTAVFAKTPTRGSSGNGENSNAANWDLLGPTLPQSLSANGKKVVVTRQIVCVNQDVEDSLSSPTPTLTGTCDSGVYLHIFQLKSTSANVTVTLGQLVGFVADTTFNNYGVMICDDSDSQTGNTVELCTTDPNDPDGNNIPNITFSVAKNKTSVSFVIPSFPSFPAGLDNQGQGLTIYIITQQTNPLPIQLPKVAIK